MVLKSSKAFQKFYDGAFPSLRRRHPLRCTHGLPPATPRDYAFVLGGTISVMPALIPVGTRSVRVRWSRLSYSRPAAIAWRFEREVLGQPNPPGQAVAGFARSLLDGVYRIPNRVLQAPPSPSKTVASRVKEISRLPRFKRKSCAVKAAILQSPPAAATQARADASVSASAVLPVTEPLDAKPRKLARRQRKAEVVRGIYAKRAARRALRLAEGPKA